MNALSAEHPDRLLAQLNAQLRPAGRDEIAERMKVVFASLPAQDKGESEKLRSQAYLYALENVPLHVLDAVIGDALQGRLAGVNPAFAPTPPQLAQECRRRAELLRHERHKREQELARREPDLPSEDELARMAAKAEQASALLAAGLGNMDATPREPQVPFAGRVR